VCHSCRLIGSHAACERAGIQNLREFRSEIVKTALFVKSSLRLWNAPDQLLPWLADSGRRTSSAERQGKIGTAAAPRRGRRRAAQRRLGRMAASWAGRAMALDLRSVRCECRGCDHCRRLVCGRESGRTPRQSRTWSRTQVCPAVSQAGPARAASAPGRPAGHLSFRQGKPRLHRASS
jgi:hypothetical protein